ncbi:hypothetical protein CEW81_15490 [Kluyvera genomosp. 3]|uniref:Heparinase II/III-like C-terminal domain-containing protein n=1 Tax=Kluyvera genomosp. 3 TaxID=2774055 RepID=A0A248KK78_9ENTR|nr:hypothetical protein CEW81_15490 [Kluyvera genomosp. 3]
MALLWWGGHGNIAGMHSALNHGHFDGLHLSYFTRGHEILQDYGFARWVNVEPKFGGRYVAENNGYAKKTVAHNTVVVDEGCQNQGDKERAAARYGNTHFFTGSGPYQGMSAFADDYWPGLTNSALCCCSRCRSASARCWSICLRCTATAAISMTIACTLWGKSSTATVN